MQSERERESECVFRTWILPYHSNRITFQATNLESLVIFVKCLVKRLFLVCSLIPTQIPSTTDMHIHVNKAAKVNKGNQ